MKTPLKSPPCTIPGLVFRLTPTGNKTTKNLYLIHVPSDEVITKFVGIKSPFKFASQANEILSDFDYLDWTLPAREILANYKMYRPAIYEVERLNT